MNSILLGNIISLIGSFFLCASCMAKTKRRVMFFQFFQCLILTVSQIAFGKGSGAVSMSMAGIRNLIIYFGHYNLFVMIFVAMFTLFFGLYFNTAKYIGLVPIAAGVFYSISLYFAKNVRTLKISLAILLFAWIVYSALIFDIFGMISNSIAAILNLATMIKIRKNAKALENRKPT